ncbi:MAG: acyl-ACP--UDP-N-acetylglucosamine O-acyltransferase [Phycisphaeraceae bacterium]|nr:acyl-ACP--UDP-N-acetylglucosamine O-acyltransferase [Phycisphaeraceae bacterium]
MPIIHPTAIVDPQADLAADVQVGPGCVITGPVRLSSGNRLLSCVQLHGRVVVGPGNTFYPFVCVGFPPQDRKFDPASSATAGVVIGQNNQFRESVTIHAASQNDHPTQVGDDNFLMTNSHLAHDVTIANHCTIATGAMVGGHASLADGVNLGGGAAVHQFCRLGRLSFLGGVSGITKDLPPFAIASGISNVVGLNLVGLRRSGVSHEAIDHIRQAFDVLYLSNHTLPVAASAIQARADELARQGQTQAAGLLGELAEFVQSSRRGLTPHAATNQKHKLQR